MKSRALIPRMLGSRALVAPHHRDAGGIELGASVARGECAHRASCAKGARAREEQPLRQRGSGEVCNRGEVHQNPSTAQGEHEWIIRSFAFLRVEAMTYGW